MKMKMLTSPKIIYNESWYEKSHNLRMHSHKSLKTVKLVHVVTITQLIIVSFRSV